MVELIWLIDRLAAGEQLKRRPKFADQFYDADWTPGSATHVGPWELETLLLEYFVTVPGDTSRKSLNIFAWDGIAGLVNWLRFIENEQSKKRPPGQVLEELPRIGYRQFGYQSRVPEMLSAVRWWSICEDEFLRKRLEETHRLEYHLVLRAFVGVFAYLNGDAFRLPPRHVEASVGSSFAVDRIFSLISRPISAHRTSRDEAIFGDMAYRESSLRRFPIIRFSNSDSLPSYCAPLRHPLWWRLTSGLYYDFVDIAEFQNRIGFQFEEYVRKLTSGTMGWTVLRKSLYQLEGFGVAESPDCVAVGEDGAICAIIECKAVKATLAAQIHVLSEAGVDRAIAQLAKGVLQVAKYREFLRQSGRGVSPQCANVVITLDDWMFIGDVLTTRIFEAAASLAREEGFPPELATSDTVVVTSCGHIEEIVAHYSSSEVLQSVAAASGKLKGYELRSIPRSLGFEPRPRHAYIEHEFERLLGRPGFGDETRAQRAAKSEK